MKKILFAFAICIPSFAMDPSSYETRLRNVETAVTEIKDILNDKTDPDTGKTIPGLKSQVEEVVDVLNNDSKVDPDTGDPILGLKSQVKVNTTTLNSLLGSIQSMSAGIASLTAVVSSIPTIIESVDDIKEKINEGWDSFLEEKFQEYMEVKKQVLDIIAACKVNGDPTPTYIMETADQLQVMSLDMRRLTLSEVLTKLNVFVSLLDDDKLQSMQTYLDNTNVPKPDLKELQSIMPNVVVEGEYLKVYGETKAFTRSAGFKTGLPKQGWMDQSCDYFAYGLRPILERTINQENLKRNESNAAISVQNAKAQAAYDAGIRAAERVTFPADDFTTLVTDYNRLLTRHEI